MEPAGRIATRSTKDLLSAIARAGADLIFPWRCYSCSADAPEPLCEPCLARVLWTRDDTRCPRCGLPFASGPKHLCARCIVRPPAFGSVRALAQYETRREADDPLGRALRAFKYTGRRGVGRFLSRLLAERFPFDARELDLIVPVPLEIGRLRNRGFNQAMILARGPARRFALPIAPRLLRRVLATGSQVGLDEAARRSNVSRAIVVRDRGIARGKRILLVDDVVTTGATADACARALRSAGARSVDVLALARTPLR